MKFTSYGQRTLEKKKRKNRWAQFSPEADSGHAMDTAHVETVLCWMNECMNESTVVVYWGIIAIIAASLSSSVAMNVHR